MNKARTIRYNIPFSIDIDSQTTDWSDDERELLLDDLKFHWWAKDMPGTIHCRPDGGDKRSWIKLGWAYNETQHQLLGILHSTIISQRSF